MDYMGVWAANIATWNDGMMDGDTSLRVIMAFPGHWYSAYTSKQYHFGP